MIKKYLKGEFQLMFELVKKVLLPHTKKDNIVSATNLFLIESLSMFEVVNLSTIMIKHMHKLMIVNDSRCGLAYDYMLNKVFEFFKVICGKEMFGSTKQIFTIIILIECKCVEDKVGIRSKSLM